MGKTSQFSKFLASAAAFLLVACVLFVAPSNASAIEVTKSVESTMTITMQESSDDDPSDDDSADDDATDDSATNDGKGSTVKAKKPVAASEKGGGLAVTGDALLLAMLGMVALAGAAAYCCLQSKNLSVVEGAHVRGTKASCSQRAGHARGRKSLARLNREEAQKKMIATTIAAALLAATCFGGFASKTNALAEGVDASVKCTSAVTIDEAGNVISANVTVLNNSLKAIGVESIVAPAELEGWTATFATTSVAVSGSATGTWNGKTVPSDILAQVKENSAVTLTFQLTFSTWPEELDFSAFSLEEGNWVYDKTQKTPSVTCTGSLVEGTDYTVSYGENINAGEGTVTITGKGEYCGTKNFTFTIAKATVTITWEPTGETKYMYDGATHTPTATVGNVVSGESLSATLSYKDSSDVSLTSAPSAIGTYTATVAALNGATASNYALPTTGLSKTFKITDNYWLAEAGAEDPEADVIKKQDEIEEDMKVLHGTITQTSAGKDKDAVSAEYTNYMNGKDAEGNAKEIRLYTKWNGEDAGSGANQWVEFRIIQVGEHLNYSSDVNSGDGSAVTFMATHSLPTSKQMNTSSINNTGGWTGSTMHTSVFAEGGYVQTGLSDLVSHVIPVAKASTAGDWKTWTNTTSQEKFWLISYSELAGEDKVSYFNNEGAQYEWCKTNVISPSFNYNPGIAGMDKTRAGSSPADVGNMGWWERSPELDSAWAFGTAGTDGVLGSSYCIYTRGVLPCFAF